MLSLHARIGNNGLAVDSVSGRTPKTIGGENLNEARLLPQPLHPLVIPTVRERLAWRGSHSVICLQRCTEYGYIYGILFPRDWLAVQAISDPQRQDRPWCHISESVRIVIAGQGDDVGDHAEQGIRMDEEGVCFPVRHSDISLDDS